MNPIKLSLNRQAVPVELGEGESARKLELREMVASDRDKFLDSFAKRVRIDSSGKPAGISNFDGMQAALLTRCLFDGDKQVPEKEIQGWPASAVSELYLAAQKLNHLTQEEVDGAEAKKE